MAKTRQQKEESVSLFTDKLSRAHAVIFTDYKGMTMTQLSELRKALKIQEAEFTVTKNTLLNLSLEKTDRKIKSTQLLSGSTATLFAYADEISPIKSLVKALKDFGIGQIKGGFLNTDFLTASDVNQLSSLPSKIELQAKVVGILVAPIRGIEGVLTGNLRNLVYALSQIKTQKSA